MPRKPIIRSRDHYYHVCARVNNKEKFHLRLERVWDISNFLLRDLQKSDGIKIAAFVLMDNHFHLLVHSPQEDIDRIMYLFMKKFTLSLQKESGRINKIFGGRYKGSLIDHHNYLLNVYKYIYRNPVRAGIVDRVQDYPFTTLGCEKTVIHLEKFHAAETFSSSSELELKWLNENFETEIAEKIKTGLRRTTFSLKKDRTSRTPDYRVF